MMVSEGVWAVLVIICSQSVVLSAPSTHNNEIPTFPAFSEIKDELHAHNQFVEPPRDKRLAIITKTGVTAVLLNFLFGTIDNALDAKIHWINQLDKQNIIKNEKYFGITTPKPSYTAGSRPPSGSYGPGSQGSAASTPRETTPAPIEFSTSSPVSLQIPDRLYGNSFTLVTNISQTIGDVLFNTADRAQEFATSLSGKVRRNFGFNLLPNSKDKRSSSAASNATSTT